MWASLRIPGAIRQFGILGGVCSASVLIVTTAGSAQLLSDHGSGALPVVYVLLAVVSIPLASALSAALGRWPAVMVCRVASMLALALCAVLQGALLLHLPGVPVALCIAGYVLEIMFDTLFWLVAAEHLATRDLKRHTPALAMSFGIGGVLGGGLASMFCQFFTADYLMLPALGLLGLACVQCDRISRRMQCLGDAEASEDEPGYFEVLRSTWIVFRTFPISTVISLSILLMSALFCLQDYLAMTIFSTSFADQDELARFMAAVYAGQQGLEILILLVCGRLLENAGPLTRNLLFPLTTLACLVPLLWACTLPLAFLLSLNANAMSNGIFEPVKTTNYVVIPHSVLAPMRMLLEGSVYPFGIALAGGGLLALQTNFELQGIAAVATALGVLFLASSALIGILFAPSMIRGLRLRGVHPSRYRRYAWMRMFSRRDVLRLLNDPDAELRTLGGELARGRFPELLPTASGQRDEAGTETTPPDPSHRRDLQAVLARRACGLLRGRSPEAARDPTAIELLAAELEQEAADARRDAAARLARHGNRALPAICQRLASRDPRVVEAAMLALVAIRSCAARRMLRAHLKPLYDRVRRNLAALAALETMVPAPGHAETARLVSKALEDSNRGILGRVLGVQSALGNHRDIALLQRIAEAGNLRERSDAIEALMSLPTGQLVRPLLSLLEPKTVDRQPATPGASASGWSGGNADAALWAAAADDPLLRFLVAPLFRTLRPFPCKAEETAMLDLVLFLKTVRLFKDLPLETVARVAASAETVTLRAGEPVPFPSEPDSRVYVVRRGSVEVLLEDCVVDTREITDLLGTCSLASWEPQQIFARANCECELLLVPKRVICDLAAEDPRLLWAMLDDVMRAQQQSYARLAEARRTAGLRVQRDQRVDRRGIRAVTQSRCSLTSRCAEEPSPDVGFP